MKYSKPVSKVSSKTKKSLADKSKFKSKEAAAQNGKLQKSVKHAARLIKKGTLDPAIGKLVKNDNDGVSLMKQKKKASKPTQLNSEAKLGLEVDKFLEKFKKQNKSKVNPPSDSHSKSLATSQSDSSPKANKKRRGKKKANVENLQTSSDDTNVGPVVNTNISKKAMKRKGDSKAPSGSDSSPAKKDLSDSTDGSPKRKRNKKKKGKTGDKAVQSKKSEEGNSSVNGSKDFTLISKDVLKAVTSLTTLFKENRKPSLKLLESEPEPIFLNFLFFIPHTRQRIIRFELAKPLKDSADVCMFVTDLAKNNIDESKAQWETIFKDEKVPNLTELIPLRSLVTDYTQFQDLRKLSERFDSFLVDAKICPRVYRLLGSKFFHSKRKTPAPVKLKKGQMAQYINKALLKTVAQYLPAAESFSIQVGHSGMGEKDIEKNIMKVWEQYPEQFGVYWENIKRASLLMTGIKPLPIFYSLNPPKTAPRIYKCMKWRKSSIAPVEGELSTAMDRKVLVYQSGEVKFKGNMKKGDKKILTLKQKINEKNKLKSLKKKQKSSNDEESLESDDDLGGRADMLESESDSEEQPLPKKKSAGVKKTKANSNQKKGKQVTSKPDNDDEESDDESILDLAEVMYLKDLAASKKQKGKGAVISKQQAVSKSDDVGIADDDMDSNVSIAGSDTSDDSIEQAIKKPIGKSAKTQQQKKSNIKGGMKMNGGVKPQMKVQKKSGATKNRSPQKLNQKKSNKSPVNTTAQQVTSGATKNQSPQKLNKKKSNKSPKNQSPQKINKKKSNKSPDNTTAQQVISGKKKASPSFQGVQVNPKTKNKKQGLSAKQAKTAQIFKQQTVK